MLRSSVPKIESIRPGGTLDASLATYPLAELLLGILRGNLSGKLDLFLHPEPRNVVVFKNGVPVSVQLPDGGVSLVKILIDSGELPHDRGLDLLRVAEASGRSEEAVIEQHKVLSAGALDEARRRRSRAQMVRLFDAGALDFRFSEGSEMPKDMPLTILQPLPLVFEGLYRAKDKSVVQRFLETHGRSAFSLSGTFPRGVDPFEWGAQVERVVTQAANPLSLQRLVQSGLPKDVAAVAMASLYLADMLDLREQGAGLRPAPTPAEGSAPRLPEPRRVPPAVPTPAGGVKSPPPAAQTGGLVIHRRSGPAAAPSSPPAAAPVSAPPPRAPAAAPVSKHDAELQSVRKRVGPIAAQTYYQLLRVTPGTPPAQVERAYRFLLRRIEDEGEDPGWLATKGVLQEAFEVLKEPERANRYTQLVERSEKSSKGMVERHAFEAEPKVDRALRAMAEGRTAEASFNLAWAERLDSTRTDVPVLMAVLDFMRASGPQRTSDARGLQAFLAQELARQPHDWRLKICQALVLSELSDMRGAQALLVECPEADHPMARLVRTRLRGG